MVADLFEESQVESDSETERTCGTCGKRLSYIEFYRDGKDKDGNTKYRRDCKDCFRKTRMMSRHAKRVVAPEKKKGGRKSAR